MLKKFLSMMLLAVVCCGLYSCNEAHRSYKIVKVMDDGREEVEELVAPNDTVALSQFIDRMSKSLVESLQKNNDHPFKEMYIVSPSGDTLNTNKELLNAVTKDVPNVSAPAPAQEGESATHDDAPAVQDAAAEPQQ